MRNVVLATVLALALMLPTAASAHHIEDHRCVTYRATTVCFMFQSPTWLYWSTPWYSGRTVAF